jgi:hypothetical protein
VVGLLAARRADFAIVPAAAAAAAPQAVLQVVPVVPVVIIAPRRVAQRGKPALTLETVLEAEETEPPVALQAVAAAALAEPTEEPISLFRHR